MGCPGGGPPNALIDGRLPPGTIVTQPYSYGSGLSRESDFRVMAFEVKLDMWMKAVLATKIMQFKLQLKVANFLKPDFEFFDINSTMHS
eukprot:SAG11_NODE_1625_length_4552_cov_3.448586_4_plen_89_part_00